MLAEERFAAILSILQKQRTVTVLELTQALSISESTIRRDLVALHKMGKLKKVHGGATLLHKEYGLYETEVAARSEEHVEEKKRIARYAASLIQAHDFFFGTNGITVDSGFTTPDTNEAYVKMEAMKHAQKCYVLADSGKFGTCTSITTADISDATIITGKGVEKEYLEEADIIEVEE